VKKLTLVLCIVVLIVASVACVGFTQKVAASGRPYSNDTLSGTYIYASAAYSFGAGTLVFDGYGAVSVNESNNNPCGGGVYEVDKIGTLRMTLTYSCVGSPVPISIIGKVDHSGKAFVFFDGSGSGSGYEQ
jgi:hypothetical protein